ncbi:MAG TPA: Rieske 2Fe-2S domain-containing protein [Candidatus Binatus sp.]|nr:Rieske 2Fe-2S domain-containing protein [Candidatus Binatus sp.]
MDQELPAPRVVRVGTVHDIPEGQGREVTVEGRKIALFKTNGKVFAVADRCLHRGGPLSLGELNDYTVTCPWHGWRYDVRTGAFEIIPTLKVKSYKLEQRGEELYVELD